MEKSDEKKEESELEEGEISEDQEEKSDNPLLSNSNTFQREHSKNNIETHPFTNKSFGLKRPQYFQKQPYLNRNRFPGSNFYGQRDVSNQFTSVRGHLHPVIKRPYFGNNRFRHMLRGYSTLPYLNKGRIQNTGIINGNHVNTTKTKNFSQNMETEASFEELLEQYRQIKFLLKNLNEEEEKRLDENKANGKYNKYTDYESGNKENRRKRKLSVSNKRCKQLSDHLIDKNKSSAKRRYSDSSEKHSISCETLKNSKGLSNQENSIQMICAKENNEEEEDILELRKQALATLSKQTNLQELENKSEEFEKSQVYKNENNNNDHMHLELPIQKENLFCNSLGDNYEQVEMDLDSDENPNSLESSLSKDEIDDKILREQLLQSLFEKKQIQEQKETFSENAPSGTAISNAEEAKDSDKIIPEEPLKSNYIEPLQTTPLVINLAEDSTSSNSDNDSKECQENIVVDNKEVLPASLEELLKQARKKSEKKTVLLKSIMQTPSSVYKLSKAQQLEYRKLKEEIAKRESSQKIENKDLNMENMKNNSKLEEKLSLERLKLKNDQEKLRILKSQLIRKKTVARSAHNKVQKLKQQLAVAEKVMTTELEMVKICNLQIKELQKCLNERMLEIKELEKQCKSGYYDCGKNEQKQFLNSLRTKSVTLKNPPSKKKIEVNILQDRQKAKMTGEEIAIEKKRLQTLEREITTKLQELRMKSRKTVLSKKLRNSSNFPKSVNEKLKKNITDLAQKQISNKEKKLNFSPHTIKNNDKLLHNDSNESNKFLEVSIEEMNCTENLGNNLPLKCLKNIKEHENMPELYLDKGILIHFYQLCDVFWPKVKKINLSGFYQELCPQPSTFSSDINIDYEYNSPLLHINSYRLNPHFLFNERHLSSNTYAHGIDARSRICRFDLLGTCNDDQCKWQHYDDYKLKENETLADLLAFAPIIAKVEPSDNIQLCEKKFQKTVQNIFQENPSLSLEELCKIVASKVNASLQNKAPYFVSLTKRFWKPNIKNQNNISEDNEFPTKIAKEWSCFESSLQDYDFDNLITETDQRYFNMKEKGIDKLEAAVTENPQNIQIWLKLAYKYLHNSESELCLDHSLNVLSRGLENNPHSPELWQHYLNLYAQHPASDDILGVCREALGLSPTYEIWWKYLQFAKNFQSKQDICLEMMEYLTSQKGMNQISNHEILSHCILELIIYQVQLSLQVENHETAIILFKKKLTLYNKGSNYNQSRNHKECKIEDLNTNSIPEICPEDKSQNLNDTHENEQFERNKELLCEISEMYINETERTFVSLLTEKDYCFALLCYIYLFVFNSFPAFIFQNGQNSLGHIVSKDLFLIDWTQYSRLHKPKEIIKETIEQALSFYLEKSKDKDLCFPFYFQLITLELFNKNYESAIKICQQLQELSFSNNDVWLLLARVYIHQSLNEEASEVFEKAISLTSADPYLYYAAALFHFNNNNIEKAKCMLENYIHQIFSDSFALYKIPQNTILLYRKLLENNSEIIHAVPKQRKNEFPEKSQAYLWLNYILYLRCMNHGHSDIVIAFEAALASFHSSIILKIIWWQYIQYSVSNISKITNIKALINLISECIISMPTNIFLPHVPGKVRTDYSFHTALSDLFLTFPQYCFDKATVAERFLQLMPNNTAVIERAVYYYMTSGKEEFALSLLKKKLHNKIYSMNLWRMAIYLLLKENDQQEIHKTYNEAVQAIPYSSVLWKEYLLYEISENHKEHAEILTEKCKNLQLNFLDDYR